MERCNKIVKRQMRQWTRSLERALANPGPDQLSVAEIAYWLSPEGREVKLATLRAYWR